MLLVDENAVFMPFLMISDCYLPRKAGDNSCAIIMTFENVIRFATSNILHCEDRANGGFEHVGTYCAAGGPHKTSYRKPIYAPATCMNISSKA